jgi:predicted aldo/keto reductase-like oxidoreductase
MQYRKDKNGNDLSMLGYGCMRFTKKGSSIDIEKAEKEIMAGFKAGVNYYDTAYIYPGSEAALGEIVERNGIRDKINIATKLPQYLIRNSKGLDKYFNEELSRLRTDHVDYYLMHHLTDVEMWEKLKAVGIHKWIDEKKASGQIRNIGFSYHGNTDNFIKILNDYDWDFCQIQYNYLDEVTQAGVDGLKAAAAKGIPVVIMEPLRGGKLVNMLPDKAKAAFAESERSWTPAEWAFRWLYNQPGVTVVLSGMNSSQMVEENVKTASEALPDSFTESDFELLEKVKNAIKANEKVGCTGCRYCMPCPKGVDIPGTFACYNTMFTENKRDGRFEYARTVGLTKEPGFVSQCIECGKCEKHCPQEIQIRDMIKKADKEVSPWYMKAAISVAKKFLLRGKK